MMQSNQSAPTECADSCGTRLRLAREQAGLSREQVSARLRMPVRSIEALENGDWARIGAPVFVRGQLRSYGRLLGVDLAADVLQAEVGPVAPPELVSHSHVPRYRHVIDQATRRAVYIAITAAIAVPVWLTTTQHLSSDVQVQSLDAPAAPVAAQGEPAGVQLRAPERTPVIASIAPVRQAARAPETVPALSLSFDGESWVQVFAPDGSTLEQGLLGAGERLRYEAGEVGHVVLGNTAAVEVLQEGESVDLTPYSRANVARFKLSSDGSLAPVAD